MERSSRDFQPSSSKRKKNPKQHLFNSPNTYITENSRWVPLINKQMLALEKKKKKTVLRGETEDWLVHN